MGDSLNDLLDVASTPACAGLTWSEDLRSWGICLYPRVRGADDLLPLGTDPGLASTPACARLTLSVSECAYPGSLYPRLRGADLAIVALPALVMPLPPHARG